MFSFITNLVTRKKDEKSLNESSEKSKELDVNKTIQAIDTNDEINKETGLPFTQVELVRNYLLNSLSPDLKYELYTSCWENIENNTKKSNKSYLYDFIKIYITIKAQDTISEYKLNKEFRDHIKINNENNQAILEELLALSKVYPYILSTKDSNIDEDIKAEIEYIKELKVADAYPLMLIFLKDYYKKNLSKDELLELLLFIQTIIVRRYVVNGLTTNMLPKIYTSLIKQTTKDNYSKLLFKAAFSMTGYSRVPDNEEFADCINTNKYRNDSVTNYILKRLEKDNVLDPMFTQNKQNLSAQKVLFAGKNDIIEDIETLKASLTQSFLKIWHVPFNDNTLVTDAKEI